MEFKFENPLLFSEKQYEAYANLIGKSPYLKTLRGRHPWGMKENPITICGAYNQNHLVGCLILTTDPVLSFSDLHYLFVTEEYRKQGIAHQLVSQCQAYLIKQNIHIVMTRYVDDQPYTPAIKAIAKKEEWSNPDLEVVRYFFDHSMSAPWLKKEWPLPPDIEMFYWKDLTDSERQALLLREINGSFQDDIAPFKSRYALEPSTSFGIRYKGEVAGWLLTHRLKRDTVRYTSLYIDPEIRTSACYMRMLSDSINVTIADMSLNSAFLEFNPKSSNIGWSRFLRKYLLPYTSKVEIEYSINKQLIPYEEE